VLRAPVGIISGLAGTISRLMRTSRSPQHNGLRLKRRMAAHNAKLRARTANNV